MQEAEEVRAPMRSIVAVWVLTARPPRTGWPRERSPHCALLHYYMYRKWVFHAHGPMGKGNRVRLPPCVVEYIRDRFREPGCEATAPWGERCMVLWAGIAGAGMGTRATALHRPPCLCEILSS